jgi:hypothetical protein
MIEAPQAYQVFEVLFCSLAHFLDHPPCHGNKDDSKNGPDCGKRPCSPDIPGIIESANLKKARRILNTCVQRSLRTELVEEFLTGKTKDFMPQKAFKTPVKQERAAFLKDHPNPC